MPLGRNPMDYVVKSVVMISLTAFVLILLNDLLIPLAAGVLFAVALHPVYASKPFRKIKRDKLRAFALTAAFTGACLLPASAVLVTGVSEVVQIVKENKETLNKIDTSGSAANTKQSVQDLVDEWLRKNENLDALLSKRPFNRDKIVTGVAQGATKIQGAVLDIGGKTLAAIPGLIIALVIVLLTMYYLLLDYAFLTDWLSNLPAFKKDELKKIGRTFADTCNSVVVASVISGTVQGSILALGSLISGFGSPLLIALFTFFCSFLPLLGTGAVTLSLIAFGALNGEWGTCITFAVTGVVAGLADNLVAPLVTQHKAKVHPLITFVSALSAIAILGPLGLFIGPVVTATLIRSFMVFSGRNLASAG